MENSYSYLKNYIEEHLLDGLSDCIKKPESLYNSMVYSLQAGGKRLRPVLLLSSYMLLSGKDKLQTALPFALSAEYIQTYSLVHDDLPAMDNDDYRRGKPTNHKIYGEGGAILAGDGLLSAAYENIANTLSSIADPKELMCSIDAFKCLAEGTGINGMVAGQAADINPETLINAENLAFIHHKKTCDFIYSCVMCGAYLAGANTEDLENMSVYGESIGLAFQIIDDIEDYGDGDAASYVSLYGMEKSKKDASHLLDKAALAIAKYGENNALIEICKKLRSKLA